MYMGGLTNQEKKITGLPSGKISEDVDFVL